VSETISIDGSETNAAALQKDNDEHGTSLAIHQVTYLNIIDESTIPDLADDHGHGHGCNPRLI
jgi:hypothetical protein